MGSIFQYKYDKNDIRFLPTSRPKLNKDIFTQTIKNLWTLFLVHKWQKNGAGDQ